MSISPDGRTSRHTSISDDWSRFPRHQQAKALPGPSPTRSNSEGADSSGILTKNIKSQREKKKRSLSHQGGHLFSRKATGVDHAARSRQCCEREFAQSTGCLARTPRPHSRLRLTFVRESEALRTACCCTLSLTKGSPPSYDTSSPQDPLTPTCAAFSWCAPPAPPEDGPHRNGGRACPCSKARRTCTKSTSAGGAAGKRHWFVFLQHTSIGKRGLSQKRLINARHMLLCASISSGGGAIGRSRAITVVRSEERKKGTHRVHSSGGNNVVRVRQHVCANLCFGGNTKQLTNKTADATAARQHPPVPVLDELFEQLVGLGGSQVLEVLLLFVVQPHLELHRAGEVVLLADLDLGCDRRTATAPPPDETNSTMRQTK